MDAPVTARFFGPGLPSTGEDAPLRLVAGYIEVRSSAGTQRSAIAALRVREVVSVQRGLELSWDSPQGPYAAQVYDAAIVRSLQQHPDFAATPQMRELLGKQRRHSLGRKVGWALVALFVLAPLIALIGFILQADRIAGALAGRIPVAQEAAIGKGVFASMKATLKLRDEGPAAAAVRELGAKLTAGSRYQYEFHVTEDKTINAFALPGGVVVVNTGLLAAAKRPEELAGVLAHEVQHVELRHSLRSMVKELGLRGLWAAFTGDLGGTMAGQAAFKLTTLRFSRDAESDADSHGFNTLVRLEVDPKGMVDFFGTMGKAEGASPPAWLSTHPASEARQKVLQTKLDALGTRSFPALQMPWPLQP